MLYCFIQEELAMLPAGDPLLIQAAYAKAIAAFCSVSLATGDVADEEHGDVDLNGKPVFLRGSCDHYLPALKLLESKGCILLENAQDAERIERWETLGLAGRRIASLLGSDVKTGAFTPEVQTILTGSPVVFLKSRKKGFSAKVSARRLLNRDPVIAEMVDRYCGPDDELLMSELMDIKRDSLGAKESRHFVKNGKIMNASRPIHSLVHTVPKTLLREAERIVERISRIESFPDSYVLDLCMVESDGSTAVDIVELNPIGCAMCYVNNSIFEEILPEILPRVSQWRFGPEYCFDFRHSPERYRLDRHSGEYAGFAASGQYDLSGE